MEPGLLKDKTKLAVAAVKGEQTQVRGLCGGQREGTDAHPVHPAGSLLEDQLAP